MEVSEIKYYAINPQFMVKVSQGLPTEEVALVYNIDTREEVRIMTGKMIHCIRFGKTLLVSKEIYDSLCIANNLPKARTDKIGS